MIKQYNVVIAKLENTSQHVQKKSRPVIIVSNDLCNKHSPTITVIPITSQAKRNLPTHYTLHSNKLKGGEAIVLAEQIITIDKSEVYKSICSLDTEQRQRVQECIKRQLNL